MPSATPCGVRTPPTAGNTHSGLLPLAIGPLTAVNTSSGTPLMRLRGRLPPLLPTGGTLLSRGDWTRYQWPIRYTMQLPDWADRPQDDPHR